MTAPDIRVGDLIKATRKGAAEQVAQGRVAEVSHYYVDLEPHLTLTQSKWDFEVLDRPLPPIDEELLSGAVKVYGEARQLTRPEFTRDAIRAVINFVNEYHNKESK